MKKLKDNLYSVGVQNPTLRVFDIIMATKFGTTYGSYLILGDEKKALIDGSHSGFEHIWFDHIEGITPLDSIDYLVINHTEPDHSYAVAAFLDKNPNVTVIGSVAAINNLKAITNRDFNSQVVKGEDTLDLGGRRLVFKTTPNVHWPDTMITYCPELKALFPCDFLGSHFCEPTERLETCVKKELYDIEFENYYRSIMSPFPAAVRNALAYVETLDVDVVCPSHGPTYGTAYLKEAMEKYRQWSAEPAADAKKSVAIFYVSAYGFTRGMCQYVAGKLEEKGLDVFIADIIKNDEASLLPHLSADALVFGSPTINRAALKPVWDIISSIDAVNAKGKPFATIGDYGWTGEACGQLNDRLTGLKMKQAGESVKCRFAPTDETWQELDRLVDDIVAALA